MREEQEAAMNDKQSLINTVKEMLSRLIQVNAILSIYQSIFTVKKEHPEIWEKTENFFNATTCAYEYIMVLELIKLYDDREDRNLNKVINICSQNKGCFRGTEEYSKDYENICDILKDTKDKLSDFKVYRDKYFAHNDKVYFNARNDLYKNNKIEIQDFSMLINFAFNFLNKVYMALGQGTMSKNLITGLGLESLLEYAEVGYNYLNDENHKSINIKV